MTSGFYARRGREETSSRELPAKGWRRRLDAGLDRMLRGFLVLWLLAAAWVVVSFATPPRDALRAADWQLDAGPVDSYEIDVPRMVESGPQPVWVVRRDRRTFLALAAVCQYQHCVLRWNPAHEIFSCPCHRGTYDLDGGVISGPARESLRSFFVNVKAERVRVHLRRLAGDSS